ncbi:GGDEF domain-containing protein [Alteromonas lipolytica]|uniref:diguanylate cyclase n=1 Tax=Alteromonas lipolytica TaxID=1856405 RepID=A0A1E8FGF1_9ALTE|nr:GGDEF domain-containing protein [Alteromonas lipolytica]OFI35022.1 hypothetical protein BFC17_15815 [Alteromonas lipolytica]GGF55956.1 GGDEF domain-containing protein [Alteromonas lipolytica]
MNSAVAGIYETEALQQADELRISDKENARKLLDSIDKQKLSADEVILYEYIDAVIQLFDGDVKQAAEVYQRLLLTVEDAKLKIRIQASYLNLLASLGKWEEGLALGEALFSQLAETDDTELQQRAYLGLIAFYDQLEQPETVLILTSRIVDKENVPPEVKCGALAARINAFFKLDDYSYTFTDYNDASQFCLKHNLTIYYAVLEVSKVNWLMNKGEYSEARLFLEKLLEVPEVQNFVPQTTTVLSKYAEVNLLLGDTAEAKTAAQRVLTLDTEVNNSSAVISALDTLHKIASDESNFEQALRYLEQLMALQAQESSAQLSKQLAIQKAWFEIDAKQSQIELLDKQNALLTAKAKLSGESLENSLLALSLVSLLLASLIFWSYRSHKIQAKLKYYARTDMLTQISNRAYFNEQCNDCLNQAQKNQSKMSLILLDLDHFKNINDSYGHQIGDWALTQVAKVISATLDEEAIFGRLGGEEFGILLRGEHSEIALQIAERCRVAIERIEPTVSEYQFKLTVSLGVSNTSQVGYKFENLYAAADLALYQSKHYGRNRVYEYSAAMAE